jgi:hypothetical protein
MQPQALVIVRNPIGLQCYACGYAVWRKCVSSHRISIDTTNVSQTCLNCGKKRVRTWNAHWRVTGRPIKYTS